MKPNGAEIARLSPNPRGWLLQIGGTARETPTLDDAAASLPAGARLHLALPCQMALLERLKLPATSQEELTGMAQLQLEKTLPYPVEEAACEVDVIRQEENESTVLSIAVHTESLSRLCEPLRARQRNPHKITLYAQHIACACPENETVLAIWEEQEHVAVGIFENRKLSWAHTLPLTDPGALVDELHPLLIGAEVEGVPTAFTRILLAPECSAAGASLGAEFHVPIEPLATSALLPEPELNLLPQSWAHENEMAARGETVRQRLMLGAIVYLALVAVAFVYLAILKHRVGTLDTQIEQLQPKLVETQAQQKRWRTLAPAVEPSMSFIELLLQATESRPSPELHITTFIYRPDAFKIEGEAPNAGQAVEYLDKLKSNKAFTKAGNGIGTFEFRAPQPQIIEGGRAKFSIDAQLKP